MKKILLIDDPNQLNSAYENGGEFSGVLERICNLAEFAKITDFTNYTCVLFHLSFAGNQAVASIIRTSTQMGRTIPVVEFSLGQYAPELYTKNGTSYTKLNKESLYENLNLFLKIYQETEIIKLDVLLYGKDADVENVRRCSTRILRAISTKHTVLSEEDVEPLKEELEQLISLSQPSIEINYEGFLNEIREGEITSDEVSYKVRKISESFSRYGKNIYHW